MMLKKTLLNTKNNYNDDDEIPLVWCIWIKSNQIKSTKSRFIYYGENGEDNAAPKAQVDQLLRAKVAKCLACFFPFVVGGIYKNCNFRHRIDYKN